MSPRLIVIIALVAVVSAAGASVITSALVRPEPVFLGSGVIAKGSPSDEDRRRHREEFFDGDASRDIRGGQEMKPRW